MENQIQQRLQFAQEIAKRAGLYALDKQNQPKTVEFKTTKDIVTEVDLACDLMIRQAIQEKFPKDNIITEEDSNIDQGSFWTWVIDPIDGTVNYSRGLPLWGVAVAVMYENYPIAGAQYLPRLDELYFASKGQGAFCNSTQIHVSDIPNLNEIVISNGDYNVGNVQVNNELNLKSMAVEAQKFQRIKCFGSAIVESSFVASGKLDAYMMRYSHLWDIAVGVILVEEAGGKVTHINGEDLQMIDGCDVLFTHGKFHADIVETLKI